MNGNMKEVVINGVLLFLILFFLVFFVTTKGEDKLELNFDFNFNSSSPNDFSYPVYASENNGLYKNLAGNGMYAFVGKNVDDTYRVYFIKTTGAVKTVSLKLDSINMVDGEGIFIDESNTEVAGLKMKLKFGKNEIEVGPADPVSLSNAQLGGTYLKRKEIEQFTMSEFEY